jgi:dGTPase
MVLKAAHESHAYSSADRERFLDEPAKRKGRTEFARDRARIIHSFALRRLAAKTQVIFHELDSHTRLSAHKWDVN